MFSKEKKAYENDDYSYQEHKDGNPVDSVHVTNPAGMRCIWIALFDIEIFC